MPPTPVHARTEDRICWISIDRPEKLNALNQEVIAALEAAFDAAANDPGCHVVVLRGTGDRAFVAGADIGELRSLEVAEASAFVQRGHALMNRIERLGKPVLAAINGFALGGGCELALACTLRLAVEHARIGLPEVKLGLIPGYGGTQRLARLVGRGRALQLMLQGEPIDAGKALSWGLVNEVIPAERFDETIAERATALAAGAPLAQKAILDVVHRGADRPLDEALALEVERFKEICASEDMREGTAAFLEKRPPGFRGR